MSFSKSMSRRMRAKPVDLQPPTSIIRNDKNYNYVENSNYFTDPSYNVDNLNKNKNYDVDDDVMSYTINTITGTLPSSLPPKPTIAASKTALEKNNSQFIECQIKMLRRLDSPSTVLNILDIFLDMKLNENVTTREAFCNTSICHNLSQMIKETPPKAKNPFCLDGMDKNIDSDNASLYAEEEDEVMIRKGCRLIRNLTFNDKSGYFIQEFATNGTVEILTRRMKKFYKNEGLQEEAFRVLFYISFANFDEHNIATHIFNDSVLNVICDTMNAYPKNLNLQIAAMSCLRMVAFKNQSATIKNVMSERCGFIDAVFKVLRIKSNWKNDKLVSISCELLKLLLLATNPQKERTWNRIRQMKGTMLLAQIEDYYRSSSKDCSNSVANLALDVFTIICEKNHCPKLDYGTRNGDVVGSAVATAIATTTNAKNTNRNKQEERENDTEGARATISTTTATTRPIKKRSIKQRSTRPLGVSVYHLCTIFQPEAKAYVRQKHRFKASAEITIYDIENLEEKTGFIRDKGEKVMSREDNRMKGSYVDFLCGKDHVGPATHVMSYSWGNKIDDIVQSLAGFCNSRRLDLKRTYIWICCLCVNQHRVKERMDKGEILPFGELNIIISKEQIIGINNMLFLMVPFKKPLCFTRIWCIFEAYTAIEENCNFTIIMPPREKTNLINAIKTNGAHDLLAALSKIQIEDAEASQEQDKHNIMHLVESGPGSAYVNNKVNHRLKEWIEKTILETVRTTERDSKDITFDVDLANLYHGIGNVYNDKGNYDEALQFYEKCLTIRKQVFGSDHIKTADIYCNIGVVYHNQGDSETENRQALEYYQKCLPIYKKVYGPEHPKTADTYNNIGLVYKKKGDYNLALKYYNKCLPIFITEYEPEHPKTADIYYNIGNAYSKKGDCEKALVYYNICLPIYKKVYGLSHTKTADAHNNIGKAYARIEDYEKALKHYNEFCLPIYKKVHGLEHSKTADLHYNIGCIYLITKDYDKALECYEKCSKIYKKEYYEHPKTVDAQNKIRMVNDMMIKERNTSFYEGSHYTKDALSRYYY